MKKLLIGVGATLAVLVVAGGAWFYRPWAPYSPAKVWEGRNAEDRSEFYRSMSSVFPNREIPGAPDATELPRDLRNLDIAYEAGGERRTLEDYAATYDITGLMVVKDGRVVLERYWRGETAEDLHTSWSVAKSVIALLIGAAIEDGRIDSLDDPAAKYAPIYRGTDFGETSIRHLLAMSSGIDFVEDYEAVGSDMRKLFFNVFFLNRDVDKFVRRYERDREEGSDFVYQSPNSIVLAAVIRGAYGENLSSVVQEKLFVPLGLHGGNWLLDRNAKSGKELGYCCLNIRLEDFARLGLFVLNDGVAEGDRIVPEGWIDLVGTPPQETHKDIPGKNGFGYGYHFWLPGGEDGVVAMAGYNGQAVWVDRERELVVAMTGADRKYPGENTEFAAMLGAALDAAAAEDTSLTQGASLPTSAPVISEELDDE